MNVRTIVSRCAGLLLAAGVSVAADAVTVHTWVDDAGVRHYADAPPAGAGDAPAETFEIKSAPAADAAADYYSIANQWERLRAERDAQAAQALERERLRRESALARQALEQQAAPPADAPAGIVPWGLGPPIIGGWGGFGPNPGGFGPNRGGFGRDPTGPRGGRHQGHRDGHRDGSHAGRDGRRTFPIDRDAYVAEKRRRDFLPAPTPRWPRERYTPGRR